MTIGGIQQLGKWRYGDARYGDELVTNEFPHTSVLAATYTIGSITGTTSAHGLGTWIYGQPRFGDGLAISLLPRINALGITYSISPSKYAAPIGVTYKIQRPHTAPLLVYYLISPPSTFAINGDGTIVAPDILSYTLRPTAARSLIGGPFWQGYTLVTWSYSSILWPELQKILRYYNPLSTVVQITYPDENGTWVQRQAVMHPPTYGTMQNFHVTGVVLPFSILPY